MRHRDIPYKHIRMQYCISPPGPRQFIGSFVGFYAFPCARASNLNQQICISPAPGRSSKLTHKQVLKLTPVHSRRVVSCPVQPRACHWNCVFWHNFSGVKRSCWTTGSWRSCLSLEVVSSIPAGSTIIHRFICGFICVSLCQSIKIKPTNTVYARPASMGIDCPTQWHHKCVMASHVTINSTLCSRGFTVSCRRNIKSP